MRPYLNLSGDSGIEAWDPGPDFIDVKYHAKTYRYSYRGVGRGHVERMKELAAGGKGLGTYINQHPEVKNGYDRD